MPDRATFPAVFDQLRPLLARFSPPLTASADTPLEYSLSLPPSPRFPKGFWVGGVLVKKNYVSYHLMPIYMFPDLLQTVTDPLRRRMQGKSCFNFSTPLDAALLAELGSLTDAAMRRFR